MAIIGVIVILLTITNINSLSIPSPVIPNLNEIPRLDLSSSSPIDSFGNSSSQISNSLCEANPTNLLCGTSVAVGHKVIQNFPAESTLRHCSLFAASPHCCGQFCLPGTGGRCDFGTGACFCEPAGVPNVCQLLMKSESNSTAGMNQNDINLLEMCKQKCKKNTNGCIKAAAATDGIVGTVCFCYCEP